MGKENSFDIVSEPNWQEVDNAVTQVERELAQRFDFRGSKSKLEREGERLTLTSDDEFKLKNVVDILQNKLVKRNVSLKFLSYGNVEPAAQGTVKQEVTIRKGIDRDHAKTINTLIKETGLKVQSQIQGDVIRVSGKNRDDLQQVIQKLRGEELDIPISFENYR